MRKNNKIFGLSPVYDYVYRPSELQHVTLFEWVRCYKREYMPTRKKTKKVDDEVDLEDAGDLSIEVSGEVDEDTQNVGRRKSKNLLRFMKGHSLHESHAVRF